MTSGIYNYTESDEFNDLVEMNPAHPRTAAICGRGDGEAFGVEASIRLCHQLEVRSTFRVPLDKARRAD
jgi:hypothetical protein